jgi:hypothetical protein
MQEDLMIKWFHSLVEAFRRRMAYLKAGIAMLDELDRPRDGHGFWRR